MKPAIQRIYAPVWAGMFGVAMSWMSAVACGPGASAQARHPTDSVAPAPAEPSATAKASADMVITVDGDAVRLNGDAVGSLSAAPLEGARVEVVQGLHEPLLERRKHRSGRTLSDERVLLDLDAETPRAVWMRLAATVSDAGYATLLLPSGSAFQVAPELPAGMGDIPSIITVAAFDDVSYVRSVHLVYPGVEPAPLRKVALPADASAVGVLSAALIEACRDPEALTSENVHVQTSGELTFGQFAVVVDAVAGARTGMCAVALMPVVEAAALTDGARATLAEEAL